MTTDYLKQLPRMDVCPVTAQSVIDAMLASARRDTSPLVTDLGAIPKKCGFVELSPGQRVFRSDGTSLFTQEILSTPTGAQAMLTIHK